MIQLALESVQKHSFTDDFDSLLRTSLLKVRDLNEVYLKRVGLFETSEEIHLISLHESNKKCQKLYRAFESLMNELRWNPESRHGLKESIELQRTPFGTPADHACQYILELCQEVCQCGELQQEVQKTLKALYYVFYCCCCCCKVLVIQ